MEEPTITIPVKVATRVFHAMKDTGEQYLLAEDTAWAVVSAARVAVRQHDYDMVLTIKSFDKEFDVLVEDDWSVGQLEAEITRIQGDLQGGLALMFRGERLNPESEIAEVCCIRRFSVSAHR